MKLIALLSTLVLCVSANAASVQECGELDSISNLMAPYKSYANGNIRVAYVTAHEPAAAPDHFLVFIFNEEVGVTCKAVSADAGGMGFGGIRWSSLKSTYNASKGLLITATVTTFDGQDYKPQTVKFRINQKTETVTLE